MNDQLELKDIIGYLPYDLLFTGKVSNEESGLYSYTGLCGNSCITLYRAGQTKVTNISCGEYLPCLHPLSDLIKTITVHGYIGGKPFIPLLEIAERYNPDRVKELTEDLLLKRISADNMDSDQVNSLSYEIIDLFHEWFIDYRGLIDAGLAVDINTVK